MTKEEAIDKVRAMKLSPGKDAELIIALHTLIPELRESEDERIRKSLIELVEQFMTDERKEKTLAYLEKQKEQRLLSIGAASEWLRNHICDYVNSEYNEFHKCVEYDCSIDKERLINDFEKAMQKEQKFEEYIKRNSKEWYALLSEQYGKGYWNGKASQKPEDRFEEAREKYQVEWSEEEYGRLFDIEHYLDGTLQLSPDRRIACIAFLKSLHPSWKPSEEQMRHLHYALIPGSAFDLNILNELYEQLNKL